MPTPTNQPLRVAECDGCGQLFAVYETTGQVACPACQKAIPVDSLEVAELRVADSVPVEVKPTTPAPETEPEVISPGLITEPASEEVIEDKPPTVAEWLVRNEAASEEPAALPADETEANPLAAKPSLSESLGWNPGSFQLDNHHANDDFATPPAAVEGDAADSNDVFKPDFDAGLALNETDSISLEETVTSDGLDLLASDERPRPPELSWATSDEPARRGWFGPVAAAAGLLAVAAPLAYFGWEAFAEGDVAAAENREARASLADVMATDEPPIPWTAGEEPEELTDSATADAEPLIVDRQTEPASFEADAAEPPASFEPPAQPTPVAETESVADSDTPPVDPFNTPPPAAVETGDRYATTQVSADLPADTFDEPPSFPADPPAEPPAPFVPEVERQVGLAGAPAYSVAELNAVVEQATEAGRGFAAGTMSDPAQVKSMGQYYAQLCLLAQTLTLFEPDASDPSRMTAELEAADIFKRMFVTAQPREESRKIAGPWIAWTGRPHGGVFFVGKPENMALPGEVVQYDFPVGETTVPVVMADKLDINRFKLAGATEIGVIGVVVENPRQWIVGYEGDADRVVWARKTLPLRDPTEL